MGGPEMAPQPPSARSEHPGEAVALLGHARRSPALRRNPDVRDDRCPECTRVRRVEAAGAFRGTPRLPRGVPDVRGAWGARSGAPQANKITTPALLGPRAAPTIQGNQEGP